MMSSSQVNPKAAVPRWLRLALAATYTILALELTALAFLRMEAERREEQVAVEKAQLEATRMASAKLTLEAVNIKRAQEAEIRQTQTAQAISVAQTQAAIPKNCTPGGAYIDFEGDVEEDYLDIIKVETMLEEEVLTVVFHIKNLSDEITINKEELGQEGWIEYYWGVGIDVDNNIGTGNQAFPIFFPHPSLGSNLGIDYEMSLINVVHGQPNTGKLDELIKMISQDALWFSDVYITEDENISTYNDARLLVDSENNTITLSGRIPKITDVSLLYFGAAEQKSFVLPPLDLVCID